MGKQLVRGMIEDDSYQYIPLGKYVASAPSVCRGRPTFKYTRMEVAGVLRRLGAGHTIEDLVAGYRGKISGPAIEEAVSLAARALVKQAPVRVSP